MRRPLWLVMVLAACAALPALAEDPVLAEVLKDDVKLTDATFKVVVEEHGATEKTTRADYAVLDARHCRIRMSMRGVTRATHPGHAPVELKTAVEYLIVTDGEHAYLEMAQRHGDGEVNYKLTTQPVDHTPEFSLPAQLPVPSIGPIVGGFDMRFRSAETLDGRAACSFVGERAPPADAPEGDAKAPPPGIYRVELTVDLDTGLPMSFVAYRGEEGELRPLLSQRITDLRLGAGLTDEDIAYVEERVTEKALIDEAEEGGG